MSIRAQARGRGSGCCAALPALAIRGVVGHCFRASAARSVALRPRAPPSLTMLPSHLPNSQKRQGGSDTTSILKMRLGTQGTDAYGLATWQGVQLDQSRDSRPRCRAPHHTRDRFRAVRRSCALPVTARLQPLQSYAQAQTPQDSQPPAPTTPAVALALLEALSAGRCFHARGRRHMISATSPIPRTPQILLMLRTGVCHQHLQRVPTRDKPDTVASVWCGVRSKPRCPLASQEKTQRWAAKTSRSSLTATTSTTSVRTSRGRGGLAQQQQKRLLHLDSLFRTASPIALRRPLLPSPPLQAQAYLQTV